MDLSNNTFECTLNYEPFISSQIPKIALILPTTMLVVYCLFNRHDDGQKMNTIHCFDMNKEKANEGEKVKAIELMSGALKILI